MAFHTSNLEIDLPTTPPAAPAAPAAQPKVRAEVQLIPAAELPEILRNATNVAKVNIGGQEFFAVVGKTTVS